jgi:hypothetical protein
MFFKRFRGRKKAPTPSPEDQDGLIRVVRTEQDPAVRREVCRLIQRLPELRDLASSDLDAGVRDTALARYRNLLCGRVENSPGMSERLEEIAVLEDQRILEQVALEGREAQIRRNAIGKVANPDVLAKCSLKDALADNRSAAVELLEDKQALEQVVRNIGRKDKRVYRTARRRLKEIIDREALPERIRTQCEELCEKLQHLGRFGHWVQDRAMLDLLDRQWAEIEPQSDEERKVRYQALRTGFVRAYEAYRNEHAAQIAAEEARENLRNERVALLERMRTLSTLNVLPEVYRQQDDIATQWEALASLPEKEQASLERKFASAREQVVLHLEAMTAARKRNDRLRELLGRADELLVQDMPLNRKQIRKLTDDAGAILDAPGSDKSVAARFAQVRKALDERLRKQLKHAEQRLDQLPPKLDALRVAIENGNLKEAEPLYQGIVAGIELIEVSGLPRASYSKLAAKARALAPRVRDLQKWRKWGTDQRRRELCETMEGLIETGLRLEAMALRLHDLQMEWKGLDKGGAPVNQTLWKRFHAASQGVYEHCRPYLDAQAAERDANRQQRAQLCAKLEAFLDQVDWERMDWKMAVRAEREMRQAWSLIGPVEGRHRKALEKRFRSAMKRLDTHLAEERARNQAQKHALIERVEALTEEPDLGRAMDETKRLQREWHTTVPARQKEENRIWQRFRDACDAVFARRREEQEAYAAELAENLRQREHLCDQVEALATSGDNAHDITDALRELDMHWRDAQALPVPRSAAPALAQRWQETRAQVEQLRRGYLEEQRRKDLDLLAEQAATCEYLERAVEAQEGTAEALAAAEADWQALSKQRNPELQDAIERRFGRAADAARRGGDTLDGWLDSLAAGGKRRAELCLHLEILARVDSPPGLTETRLQFQVMRLTEHMREGEKDPLEATSGLLQEWYLCGPAPAREATALQERFLRARSAIQSAEQDIEAA